MRATIKLFGQTWEYTPVAPTSASASERTSTRLILQHDMSGPTFKLLPEGIFENGWIIGVDAVMIDEASPIRPKALEQPEQLRGSTLGLSMLKHLTPTALARIALDLQDSVDDSKHAEDAEPYEGLRNLVLTTLMRNQGRPSAVEAIMTDNGYDSTTKANAIAALFAL